MSRPLTVDDATVLKKALLALLEHHTSLTRAELAEMDRNVPTPHWPADNLMDAVNRLRVDGKQIVQATTKTSGSRTAWKFRFPLEDTELANKAQTVCQALFVRLAELLQIQVEPDEDAPESIDPVMARHLARSIEILPRPATVH